MGNLLSFSTISANVSASNSVGDLDQGTIGGVSALGAISGSLSAAHAIGTVTSADAISASLSAPNLGSVLPFNASLLNSLIPPTAPASVRTDVLTDGATALASVQADKADFQTSAGTFVADVQQDGQDLQADLAQSQSDLQADNVAAVADSQAGVGTAQQAAVVDLTADRAAAATARQAVADDATTKQQQLQATWTAADTANQAAYTTSFNEANAATTAADAKLTEASNDRTATRNAGLARQTQDMDWNSRIPNFLDCINPTVAIPAFITHVQHVHTNLVQLADAVNAQGWDRAYMVGGGLVADLIGLRAIHGALYGEDPFTLEKWSDGYRLFQGVTGVMTLIDTATGISMVASYFSSPCRSLRWGSCFVGETRVLTREIEEAISMIEASTGPEGLVVDASDWLTPLFVVIGAAGAIALQRKPRRQQPAKLLAAATDELFADSHGNGLLTELEEYQSGESIDPGAINEETASNDGMSDNRDVQDTHLADVDAFAYPLKLRMLGTKPQRGGPPQQVTVSGRWRPSALAWLLMWCMLGGLSFLQSRPTQWFTPTVAKESVTSPSSPIRKFESKAICDIQTGMRVVADNPELNGQDSHESKIDPASWRNIRLGMKKPDGGKLLITLLRSHDWLADHQAETDRMIRLKFPELGIDGPAQVLAIEACPTIEVGSGRIVTGTFQHSAANVIDLYVSCEDQPIGTTANHPFWSETRQDFVQAGTLQPGEELRTASLTLHESVIYVFGMRIPHSEVPNSYVKEYRVVTQYYSLGKIL